MTRRLLAVRLDSAGDVLLTGPAVRAMAGHGDELVALVGPQGADAAALLPGVDQVVVWRCPWIDSQPTPVTDQAMTEIVTRLATLRITAAVVFTSFHQSALPTALLLRQAGVPFIGAISEDYPGALLDVRHQVEELLPEPRRALSLAAACGFPFPAGGASALAVRRPLPDTESLTPDRPYVVLHPGTSVPARAWPVGHFARSARMLCESGWDVVVTGAPSEMPLTAAVSAADGRVIDLGGRTTLAQLADVLSRAEAVVVANTGPAHLAAAVGTPVVSLFAPTVPAAKWAPFDVPHVLLGDQEAACRDTRATTCPIPGHPCLSSVTEYDVQAAIDSLVHRGNPRRARSQRRYEEVR